MKIKNVASIKIVVIFVMVEAVVSAAVRRVKVVAKEARVRDVNLC